MLFNSAIFIIFAAVFFLLWPFLKGNRHSRWMYLTVASFFFYGWWDWRFLLLILLTGMTDFSMAQAMVQWPNRRRLFLLVSVVGNLGILALFKYSGFVADNFQALGQTLQAHYPDSGFVTALAAVLAEVSRKDLPKMLLVTPVGISFYTFQSMSYTIDVYRGQLRPTRNVFHFFAYLSLFPQLVAGPIVRASHLLPQLETPQPVSETERYEALKMICRGFFKKMVVADALAGTVNKAFSAQPQHLHQSTLYWWIIVILFAFQIYCDFSGYSDIAIGLGKWMGYDFPTNFNHPYISTSMREYWTRWHISLSTWFRDYVYIPLGGSRCSGWRADVNMWITMVASGFWHGAAWPFLIWGAMHAAFLSAERLTHWPERVKRLPGGRHLALVMVWVLTLTSWVMFRCGNLDPEVIKTSRLHRSIEVLGQMFHVRGLFEKVEGHGLVSGFLVNFWAGLTHEAAWKLLEDTVGVVLILMLLRQLYFHFRLHERTWWRLPPRLVRVLEPIGYAFVIMFCVYFRGDSGAFIYFQF